MLLLPRGVYDSLHAGDAVLFRADFVHAVGKVDGARVSVSRFLGALAGRVVFWT